MKTTHKYKPNHIIRLIESVENCKLLDSNKSRGHYTFWQSPNDSDNIHLKSDGCFISCVAAKDGRELHLMYTFPKTGNVSQRILK